MQFGNVSPGKFFDFYFGPCRVVEVSRTGIVTYETSNARKFKRGGTSSSVMSWRVYLSNCAHWSRKMQVSAQRVSALRSINEASGWRYARNGEEVENWLNQPLSGDLGALVRRFYATGYTIAFRYF